MKENNNASKQQNFERELAAAELNKSVLDNFLLERPELRREDILEALNNLKMVSKNINDSGNI